MLNLIFARRCAVLFLALCLAACGGAALIVPLFEFGFQSADKQKTLFLNPDKPTTESGNFSSVTLTIDTVSTEYIGSYSGCSFELKAKDVTALKPPASASYAGVIKGKDTIELLSAEGSQLVLIRTDRTKSDFSC
jgi:hypothetical protein